VAGLGSRKGQGLTTLLPAFANCCHSTVSSSSSRFSVNSVHVLELSSISLPHFLLLLYTTSHKLLKTNQSFNLTNGFACALTAIDGHTSYMCVYVCECVCVLFFIFSRLSRFSNVSLATGKLSQGMTLQLGINTN